MNATRNQTKRNKQTGKATKKTTRRSLEKHPFVLAGGVGGSLLVLAILVMSFLAEWNPGPSVKMFVEGDIADQTVTAVRDFRLEDVDATKAKRMLVAESQPAVFDVSPVRVRMMEERILGIISTLNQAEYENLDEVRWKLAEELDSEIPVQTFNIWKSGEVQDLILGELLPDVAAILTQGVVADNALLFQHDQGILVRDLESGREILRRNVNSIPDLDMVLQDLEQSLKNDYGKTLRTRKAVLRMFELVLEPTMAENMAETQHRVEEVMDSMESVYYEIEQGEVLVRQGERVDRETQSKLQAMIAMIGRTGSIPDLLRPFGVFFLGVLLASGLVLSPRGEFYDPLGNRDGILVALVLLVFGSLAKLTGSLDLAQDTDFVRLLPDSSAAIIFPIAAAGGILAQFFTRRVLAPVNVLLAFFGARLMNGGIEIFIYFFLAGMIYSTLIRRTQTRGDILMSVLTLLAFLIPSWAGMYLLRFESFTQMGAELLLVLANGFLSLLLVLAVTPIVEMVFGYSSRFRLMELMSLEQPLLRDLMVTIPGTYHHSLIVANMVEAGAREIGANALLCKVGALYHDIGKLNSPEYFIENQQGRANKHDKLTPSMSALILISHVKKGEELAREHKLGQEVTDIIRQHHGTSLISYFYNKALEQAEAKGDEPVSKEAFSYPGPKPQSKEAGLVLLADVIEASSRTLVEPTPSRIKGHIQSMVKKVFSEGQLDSTELTLKDLHGVSEVFHRILTGIFHKRVEYPGGGKTPGKKEGGNGQDKGGQDKNSADRSPGPEKGGGQEKDGSSRQPADRKDAPGRDENAQDKTGKADKTVETAS